MARHLSAAIAAIVLFSACVTSADLRRLEDAQANYRVEVDRTMTDLRGEVITEQEADAQIETAQRTLKQELEATIQQAEERTRAVAKAASHIPTDPISLLTYVAGIGAAVAGSSKLAEKRVNDKRDLARRMRGEPTGGGAA